MIGAFKLTPLWCLFAACFDKRIEDLNGSIETVVLEILGANALDPIIFRKTPKVGVEPAHAVGPPTPNGAASLDQGFPLVTGNTNHFGRVEGILLLTY